MSFEYEDAVKAHSAWKTKLTHYLAKPDGSLKAADVEPDNRCPLGQWIHSGQSTNLATPEFAVLTKDHARFHKAAADVIRRADSGQSVSADLTLGGSSEFATASSAVMVALYKMKNLTTA